MVNYEYDVAIRQVFFINSPEAIPLSYFRKFMKFSKHFMD